MAVDGGVAAAVDGAAALRADAQPVAVAPNPSGRSRQVAAAGLADRMAAVGGIVKIAFQLAERRDYLRALTLNGLCYSAALGLDASRPAQRQRP